MALLTTKQVSGFCEKLKITDMKDFQYIDELEALSQEYSQQLIDFNTYRQRRKILLDEIDREQNGMLIINIEDGAGKLSVLSRAMAFIKSEIQKR